MTAPVASRKSSRVRQPSRLRAVGLLMAGLTAVALLFFLIAPLALLWPTLAWRNRLSLIAGRLWGGFSLWISGIEVEYEGLEHLQHPAILTFNHTSYLDFFLNAAVAGDRCLVFGKRELARMPFYGWGWFLGGHPLIRRQDREQWQAELDRSAELMKGGRFSACIAPEGRRSRDGQLLPFKKGGFHLAVQTRLPVIPVVILGSAARMTGTVPTPGTIRVRILPPIPTDDWTVEGLDEEVRRLRDRYLAELEA